MKKTLSIILPVVMLLGLAGCGVAQADYDSAVSENASLKTEVEDLKSQLSELQSKYDTLEAVYGAYAAASSASTGSDYSNVAASFDYDKSLISLMEIDDSGNFSGMVALLPKSSQADFAAENFLSDNTLMYVANMAVEESLVPLLISGDASFVKSFAAGIFRIEADDFQSASVYRGIDGSSSSFESVLPNGNAGNVKIIKRDDGTISTIVEVLKDDVPQEEKQAISDAFDSAK